MFTGLVQSVGTVEHVDRTPAGARLTIAAPTWSYAPRAGDSVSVSGVCLTALLLDSRRAGQMDFDVVQETLARTTLGNLKTASRVNLEHAVRADALMGGHVVQGHIDGVAEVAAVRQSEIDWRVELVPPSELMQFIIPKGSVTIDGVSLTIAAAHKTSFEVALIPTTLQVTTLGNLRSGDRCNIETDIISRTVVHWLCNFAPQTRKS